MNKDCNERNWWIFLQLLQAEWNNVTVQGSNLQQTLQGPLLALGFTHTTDDGTVINVSLSLNTVAISSVVACTKL